ncbi:MAG TPA: geranylgeranylglycerol-phosphate geranylgeranyltransferase [Bacteroidia bacterium]|nr:geranylgeranylglycerol-phosphate geranylgeranyltransferase [Bacteroidia bacterium]
MKSFLLFIRIKNLLIILASILLVRFCIIEPILSFGLAEPSLAYLEFSILTLSVVLIAAGGNIINDIQDVECDRINKPDRVFVGNEFSIDRSYTLYQTLTFIGILGGFYLSFANGIKIAAVVTLLAAALLWIYALYLKKVAVIGNIIIAFLTALVILVPVISDYTARQAEPIVQIAGAYAAFAFLLGLVREIIKDIEDIEGDEASGLKTFPIVANMIWIRATLVFLMVLLIAGLVYVFKSQLDNAEYLPASYVGIFLILPSILILYSGIKATQKEQFSYISKMCKALMITGIASILLFYLKF